MKTYFFLAFFFLLSPGFLNAQYCAPGIFDTQEKIDNFSTNYPNCTHISSDVIIEESVPGNITNLNGLSQIEYLSKDLFIRNNSALSGTSGLDNIYHIGNALRIQNNQGLVSLSGLDNVEYVGEHLYIGNNQSLETLWTSSNLSYLGDYLAILDNPLLTSISCFSGLSGTIEDIRIDNNQSLLSLDGLENITTSNFNVVIDHNVELVDLNGLNSLTTVENTINIRNNSLQSLTGLDNLTTVNNHFHLKDNNLSDISSLINLTTLGGGLNIIECSNLTSLTGLENLTFIGYNLDISGNSNLVDLYGLHNLDSLGLGGYLNIADNDALVNLNGLENLLKIDGHILINDNDLLESLDGIQNIDPNGIDEFTDLYEDLNIYDNPNLSECAVQSICDFLLLPDKTSDIHDNMFGCNNEDEIADACGIIFPPECSQLTNPIDGSIDVDITTDLSWVEIYDATGYILIVGTEPEGTDILDSMDVGNVTTYDPGDFPCGSDIFVTVIPYNDGGNADNCGEESFTTENVIAEVSNNDTICLGESIQLYASGGTNYSWEPAASLDDPDIADPIATPMENTTYYVTVSNEGRCPDIASVTITVNEVNAGTIGSDQTICSGEQAEELVEFTEGSGEGDLTYQWQSSSDNCDQNFSNISGATNKDYEPGIVQSTTYYHRIDTYSASNGLICSDTSNCVVITVNSNPIPNAEATDETSNNANDGTATCNPTEGSTPYSYLWSNGDTTQSIYNLAPGEYTVTVSDIFECFGIETVTVNEFICPTLAINANQTNVSCYNACDGEIEIDSVENAVPPITYQWSNGETTATINNLCPGEYIVTVTDHKNCDAIDSFLITQPEELLANASATDETTNNANDGTATSNPTGGISPYNYVWSTGDTTQTITGLAPGSYTVTVTDTNGCTSIESVIVAGYGCQGLSIEISQTNVQCNSECNGILEITGITNGTMPFSYNWNTGENSATIDSLCSGNYSVTVVDSNNCSVYGSYLITEPTELFANTTSTNETANNANDGTAISNPTGGTQDYTYNWSTGDTTQAVSGLSPDTYYLTVTDANGCIALDTVTIIEFTCLNLEVNSQISNISCYGACDGAIEVINVNNAVSPIYYKWNTGATTSSLSNLCAGDYSVTITDAKNCEVIQNYTLTQPDEITITIDSSRDIRLDPLGYIAITTNNNGNYIFSWTGPGNFSAKTEDLDSLSDFGCYTLTITDTTTNCSIDSTICLDDKTATFDLELNNINVYPNPSNGDFIIDFSNTNPGQADITLFDLSGMQQLNIQKQSNTKVLKIELPELSAGLYIIRIRSAKFGTTYRKIILNSVCAKKGKF